VIRQWCLEIPEIVNISVNTPVPRNRKLAQRSRESFRHGIIACSTFNMPCCRHDSRFRVLRGTGQDATGAQQEASGLGALRSTAGLAAGHLLRGQTNFVKMLWKFNSVYNPKLQMADHQRPVSYEMALPPPAQERINSKSLYILPPKRAQGRAIDDSTEQFVDTTRMGSSL